MTDIPVYFVPNNVKPTWPTLDEVLRWDAQNSSPLPAGGAATPAVERVQLALDAVIEYHAEVCHLQVRPVDTNGDVDPDGDPVPITAKVKLATIMRAARWARRAQTPDGIAGISEITGLIRTTAYDPDIDQMLALDRHLPW